MLERVKGRRSSLVKLDEHVEGEVMLGKSKPFSSHGTGSTFNQFNQWLTRWRIFARPLLFALTLAWMVPAPPSAENWDYDRSLLIIYATETGTALDAARQLAQRLALSYFRARVVSADAYPLSNLISEPLVVFVVSTTGSGALSRSLLPLWSVLLRSDLPDDLFDEMSYAVFGLGDTAYEKFCWAAKKLDRRLRSLGATEVLARGEGDEQHRLGIDGALDPWMEALNRKLLELYPLPKNRTVTPADQVPAPSVTIVNSSSSAPLDSPPTTRHTDSTYHTATVRRNQRITADDWSQDVRHFDFDFANDVVYSPGDVAVVHPVAPADAVESTLVALGLSNSADDPIVVSPVSSTNDLSLPISTSTVTTLRALLTHTLDVTAVPRRSFFALLRHFSADETERGKLDEWLSGSEDAAEDLYEYTTRVRRTITEVLSDFRHTSPRVPREYVFDLLPPLRPREFSIASSVKVNPRQIQLCVAIVQYRTRLKIKRRGVCTTFLSALQAGDKLQIGIRKGLIELPRDPSIPIICVGPGTGIAPMRAVTQERIANGAMENTLYFGCRSASKDQHYATEWNALSSTPPSNLPTGDASSPPPTAPKFVYRLAASRDGPEGTARTYVQHLMAEEEDQRRIWDVLGRRGGRLYISGSSNQMPLAVRKAVSDAAVSVGGMEEDEAKNWVSMLERDGRLVEECWS